jgi:UDP-N-acetylmuramate dehydrogenase
MKEIFQKENLLVKENEILAPYTTFKIGGPAKYFLIVQKIDELERALHLVQTYQIPFFILGGGSNVLVSDKGFEGLVIKCQLNNLKKEGNDFWVGAGVLLGRLVNEAAKSGLSGLEWAIGIPGTVGGAIRGNAGAYGRAIGEVVQEIKVLSLAQNPISFCFFRKEECQFAYRESIFKKSNKFIIVEAVIGLKPGNLKEIQETMKKIIEERRSKNPPYPSAGSFFKNYELSEEELKEEKLKERFPQASEEEIKKWLEWKKIPAAWFITQCNLKGKQIGGAMVSYEHANFIVNTGKAKAEDVIILSSYLKQQVRDTFGVQLVEEVELVGF